MKRVLCDTSCLIGLHKIGQLELLFRLYGEVSVPPAVKKEFGLDLPDRVKVVAVSHQSTVTALRLNLGRGEAEAIALAMEEPEATKIVLDDLAARQTAKALGLSVIGTIGILIRAKQTGLIPLLSSLLDQLNAHGFHLSPTLYSKALELVGE